MTDLLPCPFCGSEATRYECRPLNDYAVHCGGECGFSIDRTTREDADAAWNRRPAPASPGPDAMRERVAKLICGHDAVDECNDAELYFAAAAAGHSGDCTKEAHTCILCRVEMYRDLAGQVIAMIAARAGTGGGAG